MARKFYTAPKQKGLGPKETNILNSSEWYHSTARQRKNTAFDKSVYGELTPTDKALLRGYAAAKKEETDIFKLKHPKYVRKTSSVRKGTNIFGK